MHQNTKRWKSNHIGPQVCETIEKVQHANFFAEWLIGATELAMQVADSKFPATPA